MSALPDSAYLAGLQLMLYGCCWGLAVLLLAEQRRAAVHWGVYSVLAGVSVWLIDLQQSRSDAAWLTATFVASLLGYAAAVRGVDLFLHGTPRLDRLTWAVTGLACLILVGLGAGEEPTRTHLVVFNVARLLLLTGSALLLARELLRQFGRLGALAAGLPPLLFGLTSLATLYGLATSPDAEQLEAGPAMHADRAALLLAAAALFNFSFLYLLVGRLFIRLRHQALHDALTGLLNRGAMDLALAERWQKHRRPGDGLALAVLDIDYFKRINDTYGHAVGDQVLVAVAQELRSQARASDVVARMGGEEFLMLMPGTDAAGAHQATERLRIAVEALRVAVPGGEIRLTVSAGVSLAAPDDADAAAALRRADAGVYRAKLEGRNRVVLEGCAEHA